MWMRRVGGVVRGVAQACALRSEKCGHCVDPQVPCNPVSIPHHLLYAA